MVWAEMTGDHGPDLRDQLEQAILGRCGKDLTPTILIVGVDFLSSLGYTLFCLK